MYTSLQFYIVTYTCVYVCMCFFWATNLHPMQQAWFYTMSSSGRKKILLLRITDVESFVFSGENYAVVAFVDGWTSRLYCGYMGEEGRGINRTASLKRRRHLLARNFRAICHGHRTTFVLYIIRTRNRVWRKLMDHGFLIIILLNYLSLRLKTTANSHG